uniref:Secreted protein n=1 Tax=Streptomyces sp. NBC_01393 TaxID=2903851 RepID=A0AAU3HZ53_9ACTN
MKKDRRVLRAVLRWTAATVVFATVCAAATYGITEMRRTDVPGLATASDGRWTYPEIQLPPLPSGSPSPFAEANKAGVHYADLRKLLLPAPEGATADKALRGADGWLPKKDFLAAYASKEDRDHVDQLLTDYALRHIAARGWTTPDGTHTRIYLLRFDTAAVVDELQRDEFTSWDFPRFELRGAASMHSDEVFAGVAQFDDIDRYAYTETKPYGAEQVRQAYLAAGDTLGLVVQSHKGSARAIPFQQTVVLQSQLLG